MYYLKTVGTGLLGAFIAVVVVVFISGFVGVAATGRGGIGAASVSTSEAAILIAAIVGFVIPFSWMVWRRPA